MAKEKNEYFRLLPEEIKKSKELKQSDKNVLAALIFCDNSYTIEKDKSDGYFYQSLEDLVELSKISKKHTVNSLSYLEIKGYISRIVGDFKKRKPTKYKINIEYKETVKDTDKETDKNIEIIPLKKDTDKETDIAIDNQPLTESNKNSFLEQKETKEKEEDKEIYINLNSNINNNNFENPLKEDFQNINDLKAIMGEIENLNQRIDKSAIFIKDIIEKLAILEKENTDLKNENSTIKRNYLFLEKRLSEIEDIVLPSQDEYEDIADTNDDFSLTKDTSNMTYEQRLKYYEESDKILLK